MILQQICHPIFTTPSPPQTLTPGLTYYGRLRLNESTIKLKQNTLEIKNIPVDLNCDLNNADNCTMTYIISITLALKALDLVNGVVYLDQAAPTIESTNLLTSLLPLSNEIYVMLLNSILVLIPLNEIHFEKVKLPANFDIHPLVFNHGLGFISMATDFTLRSDRLVI